MKLKISILLLLFSNSLSAQDLKTIDCSTHEEFGVQFCFAADSSTYDRVFGDCYRILLIKDIKSNSELYKYYLDVNKSADFNYSFINDCLEERNLLIIKGNATFYIYDIGNNILSDKVQPNYEGCEFQDAQSGMIRKLEVLDEGTKLKLLIMDCGIREFNIKDINDIIEL